MKKVVVSCAPSGTGSGSNLGMNTVDFAIHNITKELNLQQQVVLAKPWPAYFKDDKGNYPAGYEFDVFPTKFEYNHRHIGGDTEKKLVMYWGDFQQGEDYLVQTANRLHQASIHLEGKIIPKQECANIVNDYFVLRNHYRSKELPFSLATFGCTLFQNGLKNYLDTEYYDNLKWFYNQAEYVRLREPYSGFMVSQIKKDFKNNYWGVDASLLNTKQELLSLDKLEPNEFKQFEGAVGFFLGRSSSKFPKLAFFSLLNQLAKKLDTNIVKIPWANFGGNLFVDKQAFISKLFLKKYTPLKSEFMAGDTIAGMSKLSLVVTDTYHVALNCIALDVPVICIYEPMTNQARNANMGYVESWRDKRALFFTAHNLSDFLMPVQGLHSKSFLNKKIDHILNLIKSKDWKKESYDHIHAMAAHNREELKSLLIKHTA